MTTVSVSISEGNHQGHPPAITLTAEENYIMVETEQAIEQRGMSTSDIVQHIPLVVLPSDDHGLTAAVLEVPIGVEHTFELIGEARAEPGDARQGSRPQRIPLHIDLYDAAVYGNVDLLKEFLKSEDLKQFEGPNPLQGVSIGDNTVLHIAATSSSHHIKRRPTSNYVEFVNEVYTRNRSMLTARNKLKETPLHCAAKAGNYRIISQLISFVKDEHQDVVESLLTARNIHGETALHEAVRVGHINIVEDLIRSEPRLTVIVDAEGVSPLYLATMSNNLGIVNVFTRKDASLVSCAGPKGQTALHAAVLENSGITRVLLKWDNSLAAKVDDLNSTPLHYAASSGHLGTVKLLLKHDTSMAYMADINGLYPIHLAAKCGRKEVIKELIDKLPDSDELLNREGRNFLHIAISSSQWRILFGLRNYPTFLRMLNARDYQGNTPLHLAVRREEYYIVRFLISIKMVHSSIMNRDGLTPVDLAMEKLDTGIQYLMNRPFNVIRCLMWTGALPSPRRVDHLSNDLNIPSKDSEKELQKAESATRSLGIISVLIATVTFAAIFTMPGGYIADDHVNRGTPILSRKYTFKAFLVADMMAFILSIFATSLLIYSSSTFIDFNLRLICLAASVRMVKVAAKATVCAFSLAVYTMLSPINLPISTLVCVATICLLTFRNPTYWGFLLLAPPIVKRSGFIGLFISCFLPTTQRRTTVRIGFNYSLMVCRGIIKNFLLYAIIFVLALL